MAEEKQKETDEKDLGFFNDIRSELIPLFAGLVSFSVLVDQAINHLGTYFGLEIISSAILFIILYFILPVFVVLFWLTIFNYREGLKRILLESEAEEKWWVLIVIILIVILAIGFIWTDLLIHLLLSLLAIAFVLNYAARIMIKNRFKFKLVGREYRQANYQFVIVMVVVILVWTFYFANQINSKEDRIKEGKKEKATMSKHIDFKLKGDSCDLVSLIRGSSTRRAQVALLKEHIDTLSLQFLNFMYAENCDTSFLSTLNVLHADRVRCSSDTAKTLTLKKFEELKYSLQTDLKAESKEAKSSWADWLRIVQFKGLLLFAILILFMITVWYHAYTAKLNAKEIVSDIDKEKPRSDIEKTEQETFSEINISRISTYFLFLLVIPFFKPINDDDVNFDKPFVSISNPITQIANNYSYAGKTEIIDRTVIVPDTAFMKRVETTLNNISTEQGKLKKPTKAEPYDDKSIE